MLTMPLAGVLSDKTGIGKIVLTGLVLITAGMAVLTQLGPDTSYALILAALSVMGMGMGATMMPIMTSALQTLRDHTIARGSTLMNIMQQIASSVGAAVMSVVLTNQIQGSQFAGPAIASQNDPSIAAQLSPQALSNGLADAASGFSTTFTVALVLVILTFIPALMLPRRKVVNAAAEQPAAVLMH
jgi:MFS family permease